MFIADDSEQAQADVQTSDEEGSSYSVSINETSEEETSDETSDEDNEADESQEESKGAADDSKKWRITQKKWQEMKELAKKAEGFEEFKKNLAGMLGVKEDEVQDSGDILGKLQAQVESLKIESARKEWEADHPEVRNEQNRDAWQSIVKEKGELVRQGLLTWNDLWKIAKVDMPQSSTPGEYKEQQHGSVPSISRSSPHGGSDEVDRLLRAAGIPDKLIGEV